MRVLTGAELKQMLSAAADYLTREKERLNALNVFPVPDGDTGTNMALTLSSAIQELEEFESPTVKQVVKVVSRGSLMGARGNSGVILSQFFRGFSDGFPGNKDTASGEDIANAFDKASKMTYKAVMKPVEGTILTVSRAAAEGAQKMVKDKNNPIDVWSGALQSAKKAVENTPNILPVLKQAGVVDAGGEGLVVALKGALSVLQGEYIPQSADSQKNEAVSITQETQEGISSIDGELTNKYCTEFIIKGIDLQIDSIRNDLQAKGDSLLVVGEPEVVKVHVHTDHPGEVLEHCAKQGDLVDIKIDNMKLQTEALAKEHPTEETTDNNHVVESASTNTSMQETKPLGLVAVVPGEGLAEIFRSLGVDMIVSGGQSMNPSTEELVKAVEQVNAESIIILPNNKNVIFSAQQVKELIDKNVGVVPTRSVPQGISSLISFDRSKELEENLQEMEEVRTQVKTGEITYAVRSTKAGDLQIEEQDIIGLTEGKIAAVGQSVNQVALELIEQMVDEDSSIISLYSGEDFDHAKAEKFVEELKESFPDCEVELYEGGQPLYYYILSVE